MSWIGCDSYMEKRPPYHDAFFWARHQERLQRLLENGTLRMQIMERGLWRDVRLNRIKTLRGLRALHSKLHRNAPRNKPVQCVRLFVVEFDNFGELPYHWPDHFFKTT